MGAVRGIYPPIEPVTNTSDKQARIEALQVKVKLGYIQFSKRHTELLIQLKYFPKYAHDDGPDALEMAVRACSVEHRTDWVDLTDDDDD
jgi:predicted phage terminase large subunit-like protein